MKKKLIISINPEHVNSIINGIKKYEFRTKIAKYDVEKLIIYETSPTKKIVAEATVLQTLQMTPKELWKITKNESGITKKFYDGYFKNRTIAYAYKLGEIKVYDKPLDLSDFGLKNAPQSFVYIDWFVKKY